MRRHRDLLVLVVGGGNPERQAAVVDQRLGRELKYVIKHGDKAVGFPGRDKIRLSSQGSATPTPPPWVEMEWALQAYLYISFPLGITQGDFSGSRTPRTRNPSRTPYGGSQIMPSNIRPRIPSLPPPAPSGRLRIGEFVRSAVKVPPSAPSKSYCSKLPRSVFFLSSPRILRPSMSLPNVKAPNCAHAIGKLPVPTNGSYIIFPGAASARFAVTRASSASMDVVLI